MATETLQEAPLQSASDNELFLRKGRVWEQYKGIMSQYSDEDEISPEDKVKLDRLDDQFKAIREQFDRRQREAEMNKFFNTVDQEKRLPVTMPDGEVKELKIAQHVKEYNAWLRGGALQKLGRYVPTVWLPYIDGKAIMNRTTDGQGGYLTPDIYVREFINKKYVGSFVRQAPVRTFNMTTDVMHIPTINAATAAAVLTTETTAYNEAEPTVTEVVFTAYKYTRIELATEELVADAEFDLLSEVILPDLAQAFGAAENTAFTTGTGSSQPQGIVVGGTSTAAATGNATSMASDEIVKHFHRLPVQYRNSPSVGWMMNDATVQATRLLKNSVSGDYMWQPGLQNGVPDRLLGRPVYVNNSMATMAANAKVIIFADFQYYRIGDRSSLDVRTLTERYAELGEIGFRGQARFDAHVMIGEAVQVLANSAT